MPRRARSMPSVLLPVLVAGMLLVVLPTLVHAQDADGFDGFIQSGTCAEATGRVRVELEGEGDHDVEPYVASGEDGSEEVLGYRGASEVPGFGVSAVYTDEPFALVFTEAGDDSPVACGDILEPDADGFSEAGILLVQLLPVEDSTVQGVAVISRRRLERELDVTPTGVRVLLAEGTEVASDTETVDGYDGFIQAGTCDDASDRLRVDLAAREEPDVQPYLAAPDPGSEPAPLAYYGAPLVPGYGLATTYTDQEFSLVLTGAGDDEAVACGDILEPASEDFTDAGLALVQLAPTGQSGVNGYALLQRIPLERERDVTPTRARIILFAPAATS